ncbi:MAG: retroviral-like aspartic protease family protein [Saprospiraceae bacterium]|nr:retroviral-like aspartic protease family protein [Saprospiraceae bacterium]
MKKTTFERENDEKLIVIDCKVQKHKVFLALDTGASHTTIDLAALIIAGYSVSDALREVEMETASGVIKAYVFKIKTFLALDTILKDIEICSYDFLSYQLLTDFDGVLGLDFFKGMKFCIDMNESVITIQ